MEIQTTVTGSIETSVQPSIQQTKVIVPDIQLLNITQSFGTVIVGQSIPIAAQPVDISSGITTDTPT